MEPNIDVTPFQTRTKLLTRFRSQTKAILEGRDAYPVSMEVNLSNACNQGCNWCISENIRTSRSNLDFYSEGVLSFFNDFNRLGGESVVWSGGGEPTLHADFPEILRTVSAIGLAQGLMTHGGFGDAALSAIADYCDWTRISIDTHDPIVYARQRRTTSRMFRRVTRNAQILAQSKKVVGLNMNVADFNISHIEPLYDLACELGVSYLQVRPVLETPFEHLHTGASTHLDLGKVPYVLEILESLKAQGRETRLIISRDKFRDILQPKGGRTYEGCRSHRMIVALNWDGSLVVCMYHLMDDRFILGNVHTASLEEIWESPKRASVLSFCDEQLDHTKDGCQICCKGHEINKVLEPATTNFQDMMVPAGTKLDLTPFI